MIRPVSVDEHDIFHLAAFSYRSFGNCYPILQINRGINVCHLKKNGIEWTLLSYILLQDFMSHKVNYIHASKIVLFVVKDKSTCYMIDVTF